MKGDLRAPLGLRVVRYFRDPQVALWRKWVLGVAALYAAFPIDAIPDVVPLVGWLDDLGIVGLAGWFFWRDLRRHTTRAQEQGYQR